MLEAIKYVLKENFTNKYRIFSIARYEILADIKDSQLGLFWNFAHPAIQIFSYWFAFGLVFNRGAVETMGIEVPYLLWMMGGMCVWFFMSPCITKGCNAIFSKTGVITHMKFPVSILPATVVAKELFNHGCLFAVLTIIYTCCGYGPSIYWLEIIYYCICAICLGVSISMVLSVLTMLARDVHKFVMAIMRLLLYFTPCLWNMERLMDKGVPHIIIKIMKANPIYYCVQGYRDCFFFHKGILYYSHYMIWFWFVVICIFTLGSVMMYKFKSRFIDLI